MGRRVCDRARGTLLVVGLLAGTGITGITGTVVTGTGLASTGLASTGVASRPGDAAPSISVAAGRYIVVARAGQALQAASAVRAAGGIVGRSLPNVGGFAASLPAAAHQRLAGEPAIAGLTPDTAVRFADQTFSTGTTTSNYAKSTGATQSWATGNFGSGVTVAVIDTGVAPVNDLAGRVVAGPDFSGEGDSTVDSYGHGTVIAGVIAGDGSDSASQADGGYAGMAPGAKVLSVKVAGRNGATDVSTVLAAMQWVGSHRLQYNIKVVELAWGTQSQQLPSVDPLNFAVERLWRSGIVVVAAAGNNGPTFGTVTKPGDDPLVITAGAYNDGQSELLSDDLVTLWSARGATSAGFDKPDLVAPGRYIVAPKSPGSTIDLDNPDAGVGTAYIRGSGTSQASAVVSGAVALLLSNRPLLRPDQVKYALTTATEPINSPVSVAEGQGRLWLPPTFGMWLRSAPVQQFAGTGMGSLEASRAGRHVDTVCAGDTNPTTIVGEVDGLCQPWDPAAWTAGAWTPDSWTSNSWSSNSWSSNSWSSNSWSSFLTAFWGLRTPWWHQLPGEAATAQPAGGGTPPAP